MRLQALVWSWLFRCNDARYHELQAAILLELEPGDNTSMNDDTLSRRDAIRRLASLPIEYCGLSLFAPVLLRPIEEILIQCTAGVTALWHLRKGKDLAFVSDTVERYLPTLKETVKVSTDTQRKSAADLLAQCLLLKATLSWNVTTPIDGINYAQQAETYSNVAEQPLLQIASLRVQAAALCYADSWDQALQTGLKARHVLETTPKELIPPLARSYVYAGLATYQAHHQQKQEALTSLKKAHATFFEQPPAETVPLWIDHSVGNLLLNDGLTYAHLDLPQGAADSYAQLQKNYAEDTTIPFGCRIEVLIEHAIIEANRDDQPREMEKCIALWKQGMEGAKAMQSNKHFHDAVVAYATMRGAWPGEQRIKELKELIVHW